MDQISYQEREAVLAIMVGGVENRRSQLAEICLWATQHGKRIVGACQGESVADALAEVSASKSKSIEGVNLCLATTVDNQALLGDQVRVHNVRVISVQSAAGEKMTELLASMLGMQSPKAS